jgi:hypothetical protein
VGSRWMRDLSCCGARGRACESAGRRKGRIRGARTKKEEEPAVRAGIEVGGKGGKEGRRKAARGGRGRGSYTPPGRRRTRAHALPDARGSRFPDAGLRHIFYYF